MNKINVIKNCFICSVGFIDFSNTNNKKFCSNKCRSKNYRQSSKGLINISKNKIKNKIRSSKYYNDNKKDLLNKQHTYYKNNLDKFKVKRKIKYILKEKDMMKNYNKNYRLNNKEKINAHSLVNIDKKKNPHLYSDECMICGSNDNIEQHHPIYSLPYLVYPLCNSHHQQIHRGA